MVDMTTILRISYWFGHTGIHSQGTMMGRRGLCPKHNAAQLAG